MRRSEYEAARLAFHTNRTDTGFCGKRGEREYSQAVAEDVAAAEAAGVVWDPEEEPLPGSLYVADLAKGKARILADGLNQNYARDLTHREAVEIKRRYEAWPELIAAIKPAPFMDTTALQRRLQAAWDILRGGAL